jgi:hypothetical protein
MGIHLPEGDFTPTPPPGGDLGGGIGILSLLLFFPQFSVVYILA